MDVNQGPVHCPYLFKVVVDDIRSGVGYRPETMQFVDTVEMGDEDNRLKVEATVNHRIVVDKPKCFVIK